jgi:hypothetical protein
MTGAFHADSSGGWAIAAVLKPERGLSTECRAVEKPSSPLDASSHPQHISKPFRIKFMT